MQRSHPSAMMILLGARDVAKSGQLQMREITTPDITVCKFNTASVHT